MTGILFTFPRNIFLKKESEDYSVDMLCKQGFVAIHVWSVHMLSSSPLCIKALRNSVVEILQNII